MELWGVVEAIKWEEDEAWTYKPNVYFSSIAMAIAWCDNEADPYQVHKPIELKQVAFNPTVYQYGEDVIQQYVIDPPLEKHDWQCYYEARIGLFSGKESEASKPSPYSYDAADNEEPPKLEAIIEDRRAEYAELRGGRRRLYLSAKTFSPEAARADSEVICYSQMSYEDALQRARPEREKWLKENDEAPDPVVE